MPITRMKLDATGIVATLDGIDWVLRHHLNEAGEVVIDGDGYIAGAARGYLAAGGIVEPPPPAPPVDLVALKASAKSRVAARADQIADMITGTVPLSERLSWPTKEAAARAVLAGTATAVQQSLIGAEAQVTGETPAALASSIVAKADAYIVAAGLIAGLRRKTMAAIDALADPATAESGLVTIFAAAEAEAAALLASLTA